MELIYISIFCVCLIFTHIAIRRAQYPTSNENSVSHMVIFVGLVCLCIMFLPSVGSQSHLPSYVHTTFEIKLFASFVLGMVTMVILRA